ncbi:MAG: rhodanese-like domain-containing protein [Clostridium sp.]|nr:rhodanese-like domain-containing protein [Clostridium sp.]
MAKIPLLTLVQAQELAQAGGLLLDVRSPEEHRQGSPAGSVSAPVERLAGQIGSLGRGKGQPLLLYCSTGERSRTAAQLLWHLGYRKLYIVRG